MTSRLVVCVRFRPSPPVVSDPVLDGLVRESSRNEPWHRVAPTLIERATALGGRIIGWQEGGLSVDFALDCLQDAVDFLVDEPLGPTLSCGLSHGELMTCLESRRMALCAGEPLGRAAELAELARPGEVLISPELALSSGGELMLRGPPEERAGVPVLVLDIEQPLRSLLEAYNFQGGRTPLPEALPNPSSGVGAEDERARSQELCADRRAALASLVQGRISEALDRLWWAHRRARAASLTEQCRVELALAVALAASGSLQEAFLRTLQGLARAREGADLRGEQACARFLAQLSRGLGDVSAAEQWETL